MISMDVEFREMFQARKEEAGAEGLEAPDEVLEQVLQVWEQDVSATDDAI